MRITIYQPLIGAIILSHAHSSCSLKELDTTHWTRIGLFTSPQWKTTVDKWQENTGCFKYITATDDRVVQFDEDHIRLRGIVNEDTLIGDPRPYLTGGIYTWDKFAFQYGRIEIRAKLDPAGLTPKRCNHKRGQISICLAGYGSSW